MASRSEMKLWRSLLRSKGRAERGLFLVEGPRVVLELAEADVTTAALLHVEPITGALRALVDAYGGREVPCHELSASQLASVSDTATPQGIVAVAHIPTRTWDDLRSGDLLVLDRVQDPGNVGTLIRAAEGFGMAGVILLPGTADAWGPKVTRAAAGSTLRLPVLSASWEEARGRLARGAFEVWAADARGEPLSRSRTTRGRVGLVLGNEGAGVSELVLREARRRVCVPLGPPVDSLNVGVAGAILMDRLRESSDDG